ncbi:sugar kinase [Selenomonas sp. TAMA-11512]|uniref:sugar kinase n=1 Tax=Selenomonas sp. TAMA-11512 TaxID=3095337 RepID=UPI00308B530A|nr:sugar kinase [Selenomonas sp. TAMA-11512]
MTEVILFGEPMAMFVADTEGPLDEVEQFTKLLAGAEVNVAIGLQRLGHSVTYATRLGTDPFGTYIEKKLQKERIHTQIVRDAEHFTGYQLKSRVMQGDPEVFYFRRNSAASHLNERDVEAIPLDGVKVLHMTGIPAALSQSCRNATYRLIERAKERGICVTFDPNLRPALWESKSAMIRTVNHLASMADIVLPGTAEGEILMGSADAEEIAAFYRKLGARMVFVKEGDKGAYADTPEMRAHVKGIPADKVVDTVGAGDGFAVGIISGWIENLPIPQMVERANAIGSIQVTVKSDNEGLPTREELEKYIEERGGHA